MEEVADEQLEQVAVDRRPVGEEDLLPIRRDAHEGVMKAWCTSAARKPRMKSISCVSRTRSRSVLT